MRFGDISIEDIIRLGLIAFGATSAIYIVYIAGYFSMIGYEFLGLYFDANIISGILHIMPFVVGIFGASIFLYNTIYTFFLDHDSPDSIINMFSLFDKLLLIPVLASMFMYGSWIEIRAFIYGSTAFVVFGSIFFSYIHSKEIDYIRCVLFIFIVFSTSMLAGKSVAYNDLNDEGNNRYNIYTKDKNYINVILLRTSSNGVLIKSGKDIVFYSRDKLDRLERSSDKVPKK